MSTTQWSRLVLPGALLLAQAACGAEPAPPDFTVRDSTGVRIVESESRAWSDRPAWRVLTEPELDLATVATGPAHEFYGVSDAVRMPSGDLVVAMADEIRLFSPDGTHVATVGQKGGGPGEYRRIGAIEIIPPDSFAVLDATQRRITIYGRGGEMSRVIPLNGAHLRHDRFAVVDGGFLLMASSPAMLADEITYGLVRSPATVLKLSGDGTSVDTIARTDGYESVLLERPDGFADAIALFGRDSFLDAIGTAVVIGDTNELGFRVLDAGGRVVSDVRATFDLELRRDILAAERAAWTTYYPSPGELALLNELPVPDRRAAYRDLHVDPTGAVWLREDRGAVFAERVPSPQPWEVFGDDGVWLGRVSTPGRFEVFEIGRDYVLGVLRDELDVEHVQLLGLRR